jgi:hypothetical protein
MFYTINLRILQLLLDTPKLNLLSTAYSTLLILCFKPRKHLPAHIVLKILLDLNVLLLLHY